MPREEKSGEEPYINNYSAEDNIPLDGRKRNMTEKYSKIYQRDTRVRDLHNWPSLFAMIALSIEERHSLALSGTFPAVLTASTHA